MTPRKTTVSSFGSGSQERSPTACRCCGPPTSRHTSRRWGSRSSPRTLATRPLTGRGRCGRGGGEGSVGGCVGGWIRSQQAEMCPKKWRVVSACSRYHSGDTSGCHPLPQGRYSAHALAEMPVTWMQRYFTQAAVRAVAIPGMGGEASGKAPPKANNQTQVR